MNGQYSGKANVFSQFLWLIKYNSPGLPLCRCRSLCIICFRSSMTESQIQFLLQITFEREFFSELCQKVNFVSHLSLCIIIVSGEEKSADIINLYTGLFSCLFPIVTYYLYINIYGCDKNSQKV